jgi:hypothetical protein
MLYNCLSPFLLLVFIDMFYICLYFITLSFAQWRVSPGDLRYRLAGRRANNLAKHNLQLFTASPHLCYAWPHITSLFSGCLCWLTGCWRPWARHPPPLTSILWWGRAAPAASSQVRAPPPLPLPPRPFQNGYIDHKVKYGVRYPKFIWAPCAQLYSLLRPHNSPPPLAFGLIILVTQDRRHLFVTPSCIDPLTLFTSFTPST